MPEHETTLTPSEQQLALSCRQAQVRHILHEFHAELDAQIAQYGGHPFINDLPDDRDELVQLGARVAQAIRMHDLERAGG